MAKKRDPREMLTQVLELIAKDIEEIDKASGTKLEPEYSNCLVKYSDALLKIVKDVDAQKDAERSKLANMSTEDLKQLAKQYLEKK